MTNHSALDVKAADASSSSEGDLAMAVAPPPMGDAIKPKYEPSNAITRALEPVFQVYARGSHWRAEIRAGCVLFMVSAYILFLNPLILSGGSSGFNTGMGAEDVALATSVATGIATLFMGVAGNYPWVVSVQLGTNSYFVNSVLQLNVPCGAHSHFYGSDKRCANMPCTCSPLANGTMIVNEAQADGICPDTTNQCLGTRIPYEKALAATVLEGVIFLAICFLGLRRYMIKAFPKSVLMSGAAGIGAFISFVGVKDMGVIVGAPFPTLLSLNLGVPYKIGGWGAPGYDSKISFNSCRMRLDGPPFSVVCPWLSTGGLIFTAILLIWNIDGAFIIGIFFTMFISWMKFPDYIDEGGLVPRKVAYAPAFKATAGSADFDWSGHEKDLFVAFLTFLYLDFIGSCITFVAMGEMCGILDDKGNMPRSNLAFCADGLGSLLGGLLGSSALTTYVESAAAVREGGRTGVTAVVCSLFFFASCFLSPLFSQIPAIATGPILALIGVLIFMPSIMEINWHDLTEAIPALVAILGMPFTHNIAYGIIGSLFAYVICKFVSYQLFDFQKSWPGYAFFKRRTSLDLTAAMFCRMPGWNCELPPDGRREDPLWLDPSLETVVRKVVFKQGPGGSLHKRPSAEDGDGGAVKPGAAAAAAPAPAYNDDSAHLPTRPAGGPHMA